MWSGKSTIKFPTCLNFFSRIKRKSRKTPKNNRVGHRVEPRPNLSQKKNVRLFFTRLVPPSRISDSNSLPTASKSPRFNLLDHFDKIWIGHPLRPRFKKRRNRFVLTITTKILGQKTRIAKKRSKRPSFYEDLIDQALRRRRNYANYGETNSERPNFGPLCSWKTPFSNTRIKSPSLFSSEKLTIKGRWTSD